MLKMIHGEVGEPIKDASYPIPFPSQLEYNSPAHGPWNIVHMGMLIPGSHQIYVCADNCNRGVILTAAEMNAVDRFSTIALYEEDIFNGQMEELVIEGTNEILKKLPHKPSVVLLFTVCLHHFMGCDIPYIYKRLRQEHPEQIFLECYMDPIMQKGGLTPDQKLRMEMYQCLEERPKKENVLNIIGNDLPTDSTSDIYVLCDQMGWEIRDLTKCETFDQFLAMAEARVNLSWYPPAKLAAEKLSDRLDMENIYVPASYDYDSMEASLMKIYHVLCRRSNFDSHLPVTKSSVEVTETIKRLRQKCCVSLKKAKKIIGDTPLTLDYTAVPHVLELTKLLIENEFNVESVYLDAFHPEEEKAYIWLKEKVPELRIFPTIHVAMRVFPRKRKEKVLAIGQKAAYFNDTPYFVNIVEGGGMFGFDGICHMCEYMIEAYLEEKDTRDLVSRKGLGCESCI